MSNDTLNRRGVLAALPTIAFTSLAAAPKEAEKLAADGGTPVRAVPLETEFPGVQFYGPEERQELVEAYDSGSLFRFYGPKEPQKVARLEREFAKYIGAKYVLCMSSGTASLHAGLVALGIGPGDEVILPPWCWHSCYTTILLTGALPVFAEIDESFNMDPGDVEKKITPRTKALMPVHLTGVATDMDRLMALARKHNLKVIEDTCQSTGAQYKGRRLGSIGDVGTFSFQIHKMVTSGEGGALVTNNLEVYERAIRFHDLGLIRPYHEGVLKPLGGPRMPYFVGTNYRMSEMAGAVMLAQLAKLDQMIDRHRRNARFVKDRIRDLPGIRLRQTFDAEGDTGWVIGMILPDKAKRDRFLAAMRAENVPAGSPSSGGLLPLSRYIVEKAAPHPAWPTFNSPRGKQIRYGADCIPKTAELFDRIVSLTIGPKYTNRDLQDIVTAIKKVHRAVLV